jgi:anti-anti-sigma regulatory factor
MALFSLTFILIAMPGPPISAWGVPARDRTAIWAAEIRRGRILVNVIKEQKGKVLIVRLSGSIEENVNFDEAIGAPAREMTINCKEITRLNSVGVKAWIRYFQAARARGTRLRFEECSTAIVEQFNLISNFACEGKIESVYVPFACTSCKMELVGLFKTDDLKRMNLRPPELKCSKCGGRVVFDDIAEEYFAFLTR